MDTLETFRQHGLDPQQVGAFGRPVAARTGAVLLPGNHHQWRAIPLVAHGGVIDRQFLAAGHVQRIAAFLAAQHLVANTDVGEGAAHHHFVVAAPRTVGVEVPRLHALLAQVAPGRAVGLDVAGWRDMVGGHRVAQQGQDACALYVADFRRRAADVVEERRVLDVGGGVLPGIGGGLGHCDGLPLCIAGEHFGILLVEHAGVDIGDRLGDLLLAGPDIAQVHGLAVLAGAQGVLGQVHAHAAGQRVGDHQGRRGQPVGLDQRMHPPLEVAVARQHRSDGQVGAADGFLDGIVQRPGVADAGGAAVADQVEAELVQVRCQSCGLEVIGDHLRARRQGALDPGFALQALLNGLLRHQAGGHHHAGVGGVGAGGDGGDHHGTVAQGVALAAMGVVDFAGLVGVAHRHATAAFAFQAADLLGQGLGLQFDEVVEGLADLAQCHPVLRALGPGQAGFHLMHVQGERIGEQRFLPWQSP